MAEPRYDDDRARSEYHAATGNDKPAIKAVLHDGTGMPWAFSYVWLPLHNPAETAALHRTL